jgi:hypothetical protein
VPGNEIRNLRRLLRDLTALSTMPALWVGREISHIADGVADLLLHRDQVPYPEILVVLCGALLKPVGL